MTGKPAGYKPGVLIADDSAVIRAIIRRTLERCADVTVAGVACNGQEAVSAVAALKPDIVVLDIEMPVMDGLTALPLMLKEKPDLIVLICSTLSARGADITLRALAMGAADCLLKPGGESITTAQDFQETLIRTVQGLAAGLRPSTRPISAVTPLAPPVKMRADPTILAIGSSTGGPKALGDLLKDLKGFPAPIVITQHMPKSFTALLAQNLQQQCGLPCFEGAEGMMLKAGCAYIAPGGHHMVFAQAANGLRIRIDDGPPENYCKPSVNPMLRSLASLCGRHTQAVILTGMGADGLEGCRLIGAQGGGVMAQDEATSVVWGMPGAVAAAGLCDAILPLPRMAEWLWKIFNAQKAARL